MAKQSTKTDVQKLVKVEELLTDTCKQFACIGEANNGGLVSISMTDGDNPVGQIRNYEKLLMSGMIQLLGCKNCNGEKTRMKVTQGKLDLAMCVTLDIASMLLDLGAEDYANIQKKVGSSDDPWVEEDDVFAAHKDDKDVFDDEEEDDEDYEDTTLVAPRNEEELKEVLTKIFGDGKHSKTEVKCFSKKLSKEEMDKLKAVLDEIEGED